FCRSPAPPARRTRGAPPVSAHRAPHRPWAGKGASSWGLPPRMAANRPSLSRLDEAVEEEHEKRRDGERQAGIIRGQVREPSLRRCRSSRDRPGDPRYLARVVGCREPPACPVRELTEEPLVEARDV